MRFLRVRTRKTCLAFLVSLLAVFGIQAGVHAADDPPPAALDFVKDVNPFIKKHCARCHNKDKKSSEVILDQFENADSVTTQRKIWLSFLEMLEGEEMPPEDEPQPTGEERAAIVGWIKQELANFDCAKISDPGRVTIRRLNRVEYNNTIRDLLGVDFQPAADFPSDDVGYGFDNIGDVLSISPLLMEKYLSAAEKIVEAAVWAEDPYLAPLKTYDAAKVEQTGGGGVRGSRQRALNSTGEVFTEHDFSVSGEYLLVCEAFGQQAGPDPAKMEMRLDGEKQKVVNVTASEEVPGTYEVRIKVEAGKHRVAVAFLNDYFQPKHEDPKLRGDRNLVINQLSIQGPIETQPRELSEIHRGIVFCQPSQDKDAIACVGEILQRFTSRAFRRPPTDVELLGLTKLSRRVLEEGGTFEQSLRVALEAVLVSPQFLFRIERDDKKDDPKAVRDLKDYELAARLSYWMWSSMPDEKLFELARTGELSKPLVLEAQVKRMLADPKSVALVENFAGQWLQLRSLSEIAPDAKVFPEFDNELRTAMRKETELFFAAAIREDLSVLDFLDADFTFLNERLAKHYGMAGVEGPEFRRVSLQGTQRAGLLTHASILTITSNPTRTSPVKRGKWILENILATPPPPPPPMVDPLPEDDAAVASGSLRKRLEIHRTNPVCASCHEKMDPLGFGFENFDAIGRWRTKDAGFDIDPAGTLPDGKTFGGPNQLLAILKAKKADFCRCLTEKMLTYALGRGLEYYDKCAVDSITLVMAKNDYKFSTLCLEIVKSEPFRKRRGLGGDK